MRLSSAPSSSRSDNETFYPQSLLVADGLSVVVVACSTFHDLVLSLGFFTTESIGLRRVRQAAGEREGEDEGEEGRGTGKWGEKINVAHWEKLTSFSLWQQR